MHPDKQAKQALTRAIREAGNMRRLSEKTGVCYSIINSFNSGKSNICNIPLGTLMRIPGQKTATAEAAPPRSPNRRSCRDERKNAVISLSARCACPAGCTRKPVRTHYGQPSA